MRRFLLLLVGSFLLGGCQGSDTPHLAAPTSKDTLVLGVDNRVQLKSIPLGSQLTIILPAPAEPGFEWAIVSNYTRVLWQTADVKKVPAAPGVPDTYSVVFQAIRPGRSVLRFAALKPGQTESSPTDLFQITIGIKGQIPH